jgi:diguanylate cyclase (GGDEF)-like protein
VARFGGDEFVIMCDDATPADAERVAERVQATVREPLTGVPPDLPLTASIGVALHRREVSAEVSVSPDQLVLAADGAMYQSKRDGKDRRTVVRL